MAKSEHGLAQSSHDLHCHGRDAVIRALGEHKRLRIVGSVKTGKSAMLKTLFKELSREGYVPLLVDLESLRGKVDALIAKAVETQYRNLKPAEISSVPKLAILVDNLDRLRLKLSKKLEVIEQLANGADAPALSGGVSAPSAG